MNPLEAVTTPLCTPAEMQRWDAAAIAFGIPGEMLMENASREALHVLLATMGDVRGAHILCLAGHGNNGGDAFCMARHLHDLGARVLVCHTKAAEAYAGESAFHLQLAGRAGVTLQWIEQASDLKALPRAFAFPDIIVDGLLGTGLNGEMRQPFGELVQWINGQRAARHAPFIFAMDIPSGLDGLLGTPRPEAVQAHATATFAAAKTGLLLPPAQAYTGTLHVRHIGIPETVQSASPPAQRLLSKDVFSLLTPPSPTLHKGTAGHVCIIGGAAGMSGAPTLAAMGALRTGAGLVTIACPSAIVTEIKSQLPEAMCLGLGCGATWAAECLSGLLPEIARFDALIVGPGLGRHPSAAGFVEELHTLPNRPPTVWDADALYWIAQHPEWLQQHTTHDILTPHPGELARLLSGMKLQQTPDRFATAAAFVSHYAGTLVSKNAGTVIVRDGEPAYYCPLTAPCLATGGAGDVLAGCLGTLLGLGHPPLEAACLAVQLHAAAGMLLETDYPTRGNYAREIADAIPRVRKECVPC